MAFQRFAEFSVLAAQYNAVPNSFAQGPNVKTAHRSNFNYQPKPGMLYVRSRMISSRTNDNFDTFPADEIKLAWRTFLGKPVFVNHNNADHTRARGYVVDAALHEDRNADGSPDIWVEGLMEIDAVTFPKLAKAIIAGEIDRTSMGTNVEYSDCSYCGNRAATPLEYCAHIAKMKGQRIVRTTASGEKEAVVISEICHGLSFFENSLLVEDPADPTAIAFGVDTRGVPELVSTASRKPYTVGIDTSDLSAWDSVKVSNSFPIGSTFTVGNSYMPDTSDFAVTAAGPKWANPADHPFYQTHPVDHMNIVNKWDAGKSEEHEAGMNWYPNSNKVATVLGQGDTKKAAAVISAYSPQSSWPNNLYNAAHALKSGVAVGGKGSGFEAMNSHRVKAQRILDGEDPDKVITAPKTSNFYHLIADPVNHGNRVVVDHHAMSVAAGHRIPDDDMTKAPLQNTHYYNHTSDAYVKAAQHLSQREGYTIHPHQVQAATWLTQQRQNAEADRASGHRLDRGRATRLRNATDKWDNYSKENYPGMNASEPGYFGGEANLPRSARKTAGIGEDLFRWLLGPGRHAPETSDDVQGEVHEDEKADPEQLEYLKHQLDTDIARQYLSSRKALSYGERTAPTPVDTLRPERCPICSSDDTFDGEHCAVCGYEAPPDPYSDPDLELARKVDLHKEIQDQDPDDEVLNDQEGDDADQNELAGIVDADNQESEDYDQDVQNRRVPLYSSGSKTAGRPKSCEICRSDGVSRRATHVYSDAFMGESPRCDNHRRNPATAPPHGKERELVNGHEPKPEDYRAATHKPGEWPANLKRAANNWPAPGSSSRAPHEEGENYGRRWASGVLADGNSIDDKARQKALSQKRGSDHPDFQREFHKAVDGQIAKFKSVSEDRKRRESVPHWQEMRDTAHESSRRQAILTYARRRTALSRTASRKQADNGWEMPQTGKDYPKPGLYTDQPDYQAGFHDGLSGKLHRGADTSNPTYAAGFSDGTRERIGSNASALPHFPADHNEPNELIPSPLASKDETMDRIAAAEVHYDNGACSVHCSEHGTKKMKGSNYFDAQAEAQDHNRKYHHAALSQLGKDSTMANDNEAGGQRRELFAAIAAQQKMINTLAAQNELLRKGINTLASLSGTDDNPHLAALRSEADNEEPVATTDEEARQPAAVDDPQNLGAAPAAANTDVTPDAGTDVQAPGAALPQDALNKVEDVTAPTAGTDAPDPEAVVDHAPEVLQNPVETPLPDNSGWAPNTAPAPTHVSALEDPQVRLFAALKLARTQNLLGMGSGDDLADGEAINKNADLSLGTIQALSAQADGIVSSASKEKTASVARGRVPQRASGVERTIPSVQSTASKEELGSAGPGTPDASEFGDL